jgi:hypothetical protein
MKIVALRRLLILALTLTASCLTLAGQRPNPCSDEQPYEYPTGLKGGYRIVFKTDAKEFKSLSLYRVGRPIAELARVSCGMPHKNLGYVGADFRDYFVLVQSFGAANPSPIHLIRKSDGRDMISGSPAWIDADVVRGLLVYSENDVPQPGDKFTILNIRNFRTEQYQFPVDIFGEPEVLYRIVDVSVSRTDVVIKYRKGTRRGMKSYRRRA